MSPSCLFLSGYCTQTHTDTHTRARIDALPCVGCWQGCLLVAESRFEEAKEKFQQAINLAGYKPQLSYNIALCHYRLKQYAQVGRGAACLSACLFACLFSLVCVCVHLCLRVSVCTAPFLSM